MNTTLKRIMYQEDMTEEEWIKIDEFLGDLGISTDVFEVDSRIPVEPIKTPLEKALTEYGYCPSCKRGWEMAMKSCPNCKVNLVDNVGGT